MHRDDTALGTTMIAWLIWAVGMITISCTGAMFAWNIAISSPPSTTIRSKKAAECLAIMKTAYLPGRSLKNDLKPHDSRARPNQRLVAAFRIKNCFTTSIQSVCTGFRANASHLLHVDDAI